jgi:hypothetical protein
MQRLLILIVALSLVIGTQSVCPLYKGKKMWWYTIAYLAWENI